MNKSKQNEAIAKAMGWRPFGKNENANPSFWFSPLQKNARELWQTQPIPDYTSDLNAAITFVRFLKSKGWLCEIMDNGMAETGDCWYVLFWDQDARYNSTNESLAAAICESGLVALGLWEDEKEGE